MTDVEAYIKYPKYRLFYNKLWLAEELGYHCGPHGVPVARDGKYVVRPITNLFGMGIGMYRARAKEGEELGRPGDFWCEEFVGEHLSVDYVHGEAVLAVRGTSNDGVHFTKWEKVEPPKARPAILDHLFFLDRINAEFVDGRLIEVHLRGNPDFAGHDFSVLNVSWAGNRCEEVGTFIKSEEFTDFDRRLGFWAT